MSLLIVAPRNQAPILRRYLEDHEQDRCARVVEPGGMLAGYRARGVLIMPHAWYGQPPEIMQRWFDECVKCRLEHDRLNNIVDLGS